MLDLLQPPSAQELYLHQLRQTINAYTATQIAVGEALQNAIDSVVGTGGGLHQINLSINSNDNIVGFRDDGPGFLNEMNLLFLGGTKKARPSKKMFGHVGVGIKVVIFSADFFGHIVETSADGEAFAVEFFDREGHTLAIGTVNADQLCLATPQDLAERRIPA